ncbi:GDSL-type esterase/lipase family protein [Parabacteroides pacaensis]|uniref:GDSL-type esterase/lipase family protein n=1 Tax=Parabacteroides pacaensis TaxID=2086575 RepID=UPI000D0F4CD2|nr:GDSL-type esterase/lipase family protein [Parabacteroides pacaensis]
MKQMKRLGNILIVLLLLGICLLSSWSKGEAVHTSMQDTTNLVLENIQPNLFSHDSIELVKSSIPFAIDSLCEVQGMNQTLKHFFQELEALRQGKDTVISIVQLGDSHIQCGYLSGQLMRLFHKDFGNAGRGLIVPLKLTRTNEPDDYFIRSTIKDWQKGRCIQREPKCPIGIGGIGIKTMVRKINMEVIIAEHNGAGYEFNQAILFRHPLATPLIATGIPRDSVKTQTGKVPFCPNVICDTISFSTLTDTLLLRSHTLPTKYNNLYYGLSLSNGKAGVLFHSIGVNGAMYVNYADSNYVKQLALLKPSLLILSMGTNETFGRRFNAAEFKDQIANLIKLIQCYLPQTALMITTPPECFQRKRINKKTVYLRNTNTDIAAKTIAQYAREKGILCWDLYKITGGKGSSKIWFKTQMFGRDRIHFTKETYREQGNLLYRSLMRKYNNFIREKNDSIINVQPDSTFAYVIR